ncbi:MAG TPA: DUF222 domain-containing protein [Glaciihabitans sp.]|nr:DUF222 domain-containing protein [Glaciihabitans sp.]
MASRRHLLLQAKHCLALAAVTDPVELAVENDSAPYWIDESLFAGTPAGAPEVDSNDVSASSVATFAVASLSPRPSAEGCGCACPAVTDRTVDCSCEPVGGTLVALPDTELADLTVLVEELGRQIDALRVATAAEVAVRCRYELGEAQMCRQFGSTRAGHLLEYLTRASAAEIARRIQLGAAIAPRSEPGRVLPAVQPVIAEAVLAGKVGVDPARDILRMVRRVTPRAEPAMVEEAISSLIDYATGSSADLVAVQVRVWEALLDPDGAEVTEETLRAQRGFILGRERNGMTPLSGSLDPLSAGYLKTILTEADQSRIPRFVPTTELDGSATETLIDADGTETTIPVDTRTRPQRHLDVILGTLKAGMTAAADDRDGHRSTAQVSIVVTRQDLETGTGVGWIDGVNEPVSVATIREILCDAQYNQILIGNAGEILYLQKPQRFFTTAQRRALAARDGGCVWPGCTVEAAKTDAHHVQEWDKGGPTNIDNGVLLCVAHHHFLHSSPWEMKMVNGVPYLRQPEWMDWDRTWRKVGQHRVNPPRTEPPPLPPPATSR